MDCCFRMASRSGVGTSLIAGLPAHSFPDMARRRHRDPGSRPRLFLLSVGFAALLGIAASLT
jgi:hypothetical protein